MAIKAYLWVALGSALGGAARYGVSALFLVAGAQGFPWATLLINILGSFVIGFFNTLTAPEARFFAPAHLRQFVMIGMCGGFTTFSAFSIETIGLIARGAGLAAGVYVAASLAFGLLVVWLGHALAARLNRLSV